MTCFIKFTSELDENTGLRRCIHYKRDKDNKLYCDGEQLISSSVVPNYVGKINNEIYELYPYLSKINIDPVSILGKYFHIDRLRHSLNSTKKHWKYMFDWNEDDEYEEDDYDGKIEFKRNKGSLTSFKDEIRTQSLYNLKKKLYRSARDRNII